MVVGTTATLPLARRGSNSLSTRTKRGTLVLKWDPRRPTADSCYLAHRQDRKERKLQISSTFYLHLGVLSAQRGGAKSGAHKPVFV